LTREREKIKIKSRNEKVLPEDKSLIIKKDINFVNKQRLSQEEIKV
jgi:hypothetical protein